MLALIFRKKSPTFHSIEVLFESLLPYIRNKMEVEKLEVPEEGVGLVTFIRNIKFINRNKKAINHITGHVNYLIPFCGKNSILTIHDIGSLFKGNIVKQSVLEFLFLIVPLRKAKVVTVISDFSKKELLLKYPWVSSKLQVIYNPVNPDLKFKISEFNAERPSILHVGTKSNKNLENTIRALDGIACKLLIIGKLSDEQRVLLQQHQIDYQNYQNLPFDKVKGLYEQCDLVSFISFYEGFGMPVIEAQQVGRPVITSPMASIPEVAGSGACFVDPHNVADMRSGYLRLINDSVYRNELVREGMNNVKRFQIENIADEYLKIYYSLGGEQG
ncbi:glycosyltransferase family 4 protein [Robertkochia solimangrovi]|uniref:glycosyltransferase family 4 protein n=1 Tax=Robertkochia solimangrovi TaxID=2213046 RepID=UPI00117F9CE4|nr:glycosyltransferase family 1 protein [Robertkochia solimangrovi]TRZ44997.1 glycosyltransferase family 1 protein [Robertkochia solimangrovi]